MEITAIVPPVLTFFAGVATEWLRLQWFSNREIRRAVQAEIPQFLTGLNFWILAVMEQPGTAHVSVTAYISEPARLLSFEYYWQEKRDRLLRLPEWPRLKGWNESLGRIGQGSHPALIDAIMLFTQLTIPPLDKCIDSETRRFVRSVLDRPEVCKYRSNYLLRGSNGGSDL